ncbi:TonB-dependent receptor [Labilibacter sediminis]|nr:TonB-dependent receptor [Labilibacter sediminis]
MKKAILVLLMFCAIPFVYAQNITVTGVVQDSNGESLPGVTVLIESSNTGTITDFEGKYIVSNVSPNTKLVFSFIGMDSQTIMVEGKSVINVTLTSAALDLAEVQVVGYGVQKKVSVTGAISNIGNQELLRSPSGSVGNALMGQVTGVSSVQLTGEPGADEAELFVRGMATPNDASPLTLVDGVERDFMQLDPEEIESIAVLKDASATAVFGVRGANGVIIVTTKRGQKGRAKIAVSTSFGIQQPTRLLEKANAYEMASALNTRSVNDGNPAVFNDEQLQHLKDQDLPTAYPDMDWNDYLLKKGALQQKHNVNISGGSDRVKYFASFGYFAQDGLFKNINNKDYDENYNYERINYRTNLDIAVTNSTQLKFSLGGRTQIKNEPNIQEQGLWLYLLEAQPYAGAGIVDDVWVTNTRSNIIPHEVKDPLTAFYGKGYRKNTVNILNVDVDLIQDLNAITNGLRFRGKASINTSYEHRVTRESTPEKFLPVVIPNDPVTVELARATDAGKLNYNSSSTDPKRDWYMEAALDYNRKFGSHEFGGLLLYNQKLEHYPKSNGQYMPYKYIPRATLGFVARITYNYNMKYLFDINAGYNGSENFPEGNRFGFFPSGSFGWIASEEEFLRGSSVINYMKLRASVGLVGNDKLGNNRFMYLPTTWNPDVNNGGVNFGQGNPNNLPGAAENILGNPDVTWETAFKQNYGIDMKFIDSKLGLTFDYFHEFRKDILISRGTLPVYTGMSLPVVNMGEVKNQGFEVDISWRQRLGDFSYNLGFNTSYARNEWVYKDEVPRDYDYQVQTGLPLYQPFGLVFDSFYEEEHIEVDVNGDPSGRVYQPGDAKWVDMNKDGVITDDDMTAIGYTQNPEWVFGLNTGFKYKNWGLNMTWSGATNVSRIMKGTLREPFGGMTRALFKFQQEGAWTPETKNTATMPRISLQNNDLNFKKNADLWQTDGSYIRLKNIEISYVLKLEQLKTLGVDNIRLFANGYNLLTFDKVDFMDPEAKPDKEGSYPIIKTYNFGLKFNF